MTRPFDISKFRKNLTKNITGISTGFNDPDTWISTGSYGLNYLISGDFYKGVPMGKVTVFAGESGAGKSYIVSGNIAKAAQEQNIFVVMIDTENALDEKWLKNLSVETSEDKMLRISASMIDEVAKIVHDFVTEYKTNYLDIPKDQRPKILFIVDSLGMLLTPTEVNQFQAGDMKGDMGRKAKQLKAFVSNCVNMFGDLNIGMVVTNHTYASQDMFDPDDKISGGSGFMFASSIIVAMKKYKLKEDEEGNKVAEVTGIRATCKVVKTRWGWSIRWGCWNYYWCSWQLCNWNCIVKYWHNGRASSYMGSSTLWPPVSCHHIACIFSKSYPADVFTISRT